VETELGRRIIEGKVPDGSRVALRLAHDEIEFDVAAPTPSSA
jgi:hypothetical protein